MHRTFPRNRSLAGISPVSTSNALVRVILKHLVITLIAGLCMNASFLPCADFDPLLSPGLCQMLPA